MKKRENEKIRLEEIEELLKEEREKRNWTYLELLEKLEIESLTEKDIKKWEKGLKYPDLNEIYKLSEIYKIPSARIIQAKNNSFVQGNKSINIKAIKWICYFLDVSYKVGLVLLILTYVLLLVISFTTFINLANSFKKI